MTKNGILDAAKHLSITQNVSIRVLDRLTGEVIQEHTGHNQATNSMLFGIAHHLIGDFMPNERHGLNPGYSMLSNYVPRYISLGTMGLISQEQDSEGLPAGIGDEVPSSSDPEYLALLQAMNDAKDALDAANAAMADECPYWPATEACENCQVCSARIQAKKQAVEDAQEAYDSAKDAFLNYNEETRFVEYMKHAPGYGADGYGSPNTNKNNDRKWFGLGYPFTSYDVNKSYKAYSGSQQADEVMYKGLLYKCIKDTPNPAREFDPGCWLVLPDDKQPSKDTTINMELISQTFPRVEISYRDVVPENSAEIPETIDVVYSALISTGALKQFRPEGKDYIFITEAGLWSKKDWLDGDENGLLAGYRIGPPNENNWDMTDPANRKILKENILKVGVNQVVQVVWKIQLGSVKQFVKDVSPTPVPEPPASHEIYYTTGLESMDVINKLFLEKLPANTVSVYFEESDEKRGCKVNPAVFDSDEVLYLDFVVNDDDTETIFWWTSEGEVNYRTKLTNPFYNLTMLSQDMSKWHYIGLNFTYIPTANVPQLDLSRSNSFYRASFHPYTRSNTTTGYFQYYDVIAGDVYQISNWDTVNDFIEASYLTVQTSGSPIYVAKDSDRDCSVYYCEDQELGFNDNQNIHAVTASIADDTTGYLAGVDLRNWNLSNITDTSYTFSGINEYSSMGQPITIDISGWDMSNVTDVNHMFYNSKCMIEHDAFMETLTSVTDASYMFANYSEDYTNGYFTFSGDYNLTSATNLSHMFDGCKTYAESGGQFNFTVRGDVNLSYMFANQTKQDTDEFWEGLDFTVTQENLNSINMNHFFSESNLNAFGVDSFPDDIFEPLVEHANNIEYMFAGTDTCNSGGANLTLDLSTWSFDHVTSLKGLFYNAYSSSNGYYTELSDLPDTSNIMDMSYMFAVNSESEYPVSLGLPVQQFDSGYTLAIDTSSVTNFSYMFKNFRCLDYNTGAHQQYDLTNTDCSNGVNFEGMFQNVTGFCNSIDANDTEDHSEYIITFSHFEEIGVSSDATNLSYMFEYAQGLELPMDLSSWDVSNVTNTEHMFGYYSGASECWCYADNQSYIHGYDTLRPEQTPETSYIKLPSTFNLTKLTGHSQFMFGECYIPKLILNNIHVSSQANLNTLKNMFARNQIYVLEAKNWTFDSSITSLANFFSDWDRLCAIDLSGWDVSHITSFRQMFRRNQTEQGVHSGILDYSSLDNWDISAGVDFYEMCASNLHDVDPGEYYAINDVPCVWFNEQPYENSYTFPSWSGGTWDTTGLTTYDDGYSFSDSMHAIVPGTNSGFGTFIPDEPSQYVTLSSQGIQQLHTASSGGNNTRSASNGDTKFIHIATGYDTDFLVYIDPQQNSEVTMEVTADEFKENAIYQLDTTNSNVKVYYDSGYYYCDSGLQFSDLNNFKNIKSALADSVENVSFDGWSAANLTSLDEVFEDDRYTSLFLGLIDTENITSLQETFNGLLTGYFYGVSSIGSGHVNNMDYTFSHLANPGYFFYDSDIESWDTSSVTSMDYTFAESCMIIPPDWNTSNVTSMHGVFSSASPENGPISVNWNTSNVTDMGEMFKNTSFAEVTNMDTSSATTMESMFQDSESQMDISGWDVSNVTDMHSMFSDAKFPYGEPDFSDWDVSNVTNMSHMFVAGEDCGIYDCTGIGNWNVSNVRDFTSMFEMGYTAIREVPAGVTNWDVSSGEFFDSMFAGCSFSNISSDDMNGWLDPTGYFTCDRMFYSTTLPSSHSQEDNEDVFDISSWNLSNLQSAREMFAFASGVDTLILPNNFDIQNAYNSSDEPYCNFFLNTHIKKLVWNSMYITNKDVPGLREIFTIVDDSSYGTIDPPEFEKLVAANWEFTNETYYDPAINLSNLFSKLHYLNQVDLSGWDVSDVNDFSNMFYKLDSNLPGVLDFSSLDDWTNINLGANFTRMCASNLCSDEDIASQFGYHAFEQGYRFPDWQGGSWDTTGLQQVHIDEANYPYYYYSAGSVEYDAYCFGTNGTRRDYYGGQWVETPVLVSTPPAGTAFGTFVTRPQNLIYNWNLENGLVDTVRQRSLGFWTNTGGTWSLGITPATGQWVSGTGIVINNASGKDIEIPVNLLEPGFALEMDFTDYNTDYASNGDCFVTNVYGKSPQQDPNEKVTWSYDSDYDTSLGWIEVEYDDGSSSYVDNYDPHVPFTYNDHYFQNSTMRLESKESNGYAVWELYKNGTLVYTTPETMNGDAFLPPANLLNGWEFAFRVFAIDTATITGMRIYSTIAAYVDISYSENNIFYYWGYDFHDVRPDKIHFTDLYPNTDGTVSYNLAQLQAADVIIVEYDAKDVIFNATQYQEWYDMVMTAPYKTIIWDYRLYSETSQSNTSLIHMVQNVFWPQRITRRTWYYDLSQSTNVEYYLNRLDSHSGWQALVGSNLQANWTTSGDDEIATFVTLTSHGVVEITNEFRYACTHTKTIG